MVAHPPPSTAFFTSLRPSTESSGLPILLFLPGIEGSDFVFSRQADELSSSFDVRWLTLPSEDRSTFPSLVKMVREEIEKESGDAGVYLVGESFGGVLALSAALDSRGSSPNGLKGLVLINPATSVGDSWASSLPPLLEGLGSLPPGLSDPAYLALATPIISWSVGDPIKLATRPEGRSLPPPLRLASVLSRLGGEMPSLLQLIESAKQTSELPLRKLSLPVDLIASTDDRILPSVREANRL
ncbi:MAG: hypothetical protein SGPRY_007341, partial [Prymnesium sp.]